MENKQTAVEWLVEQYANENYSIEVYEQAKAMEKEHEHETKQYWFARGILAGKENRIKELKPTKD
jgi:hypothetical protein